MLSNRSKFLKSESGSLVPIFALSLLPMLLAVGLSVDYTSATTAKAGMQSALDAASLSIVTMPRDTSRADRQMALQAAFLGNGGEGTATLNAFSIAADGTVDLQASASYAMPTNFMQLAMIETVPLGVQASVNKTPALVEATFKIDKASGWWNKTMTLYGIKFGETEPQNLMQITYQYNNGGDAKGYGTTTASKMDLTNPANPKLVQVQQQVCTTKSKSHYTRNDIEIPSDAILDTSNKKVTTCTMDPPSGAGAIIDVSLMDTLYLQMDVPSGPVRTLKTNDPNTSDRLYLAGVKVEKNNPIDIFTVVPCGETSNQAWEDGGTNPPSPYVKEADFFYTVTGKCDFNKRPSETVLTQ